MLQQEGWLASLNEHCILCCYYFESNISSNFGTSQNLKGTPQGGWFHLNVSKILFVIINHLVLNMG